MNRTILTNLQYGQGPSSPLLASQLRNLFHLHTSITEIKLASAQCVARLNDNVLVTNEKTEVFGLPQNFAQTF